MCTVKLAISSSGTEESKEKSFRKLFRLPAFLSMRCRVAPLTLLLDGQAAASPAGATFVSCFLFKKNTLLARLCEGA
jgi:hypothetical protein